MSKATLNWRDYAQLSSEGYYVLDTPDLPAAPEVRLFLTPKLLAETDDGIYSQILTAARFPGTKLVVITPDVHQGYGVPVGCTILTDIDDGAIALGPVGFDIGCGMVSMRSDVAAEEATPEKRLAFNTAVMKLVRMGVGEQGVGRLAGLNRAKFENLVRGGAGYYTATYSNEIDRTRAERDCIPVDDSWDLPDGPWQRGMEQLGSLGSGNHFIELQRSEQSGTLFVQVHTGSRGFGHGLATMYFDIAKDEQPDKIKALDEAWFAPGSVNRQKYLNAVAAGGNYAIINRFVIAEEVTQAFREVFNADLELVYEISHNLVQAEYLPEFGSCWVHRKGATRAFPMHHPALLDTPWYGHGHPVLIPGSNRDWSFILQPQLGAEKSAYTVNHGAGRRMSRGQARRTLDQQTVDAEYAADGILVNTDGHVPIDESVAAYKSSREVIEAVEQAGLAEIGHELWPLASLKGA